MGPKVNVPARITLISHSDVRLLVDSLGRFWASTLDAWMDIGRRIRRHGGRRLLEQSYQGSSSTAFLKLKNIQCGTSDWYFLSFTHAAFQP